MGAVSDLDEELGARDGAIRSFRPPSRLNLVGARNGSERLPGISESGVSPGPARGESGPVRAPREDQHAYPGADRGGARERASDRASNDDATRPSRARHDGASEHDQQRFENVHVYGGKAALCFSADETRQGEFTVRVEAAPATTPRNYDWKQKVALQFTCKELPRVLAVLMGWLTSVEFQAHGPAKDKAISLTNQEGGKVFVNLRQGKSARAVPVMADDLFAVISLIIKQLRRNNPFLSGQDVLAVTRSIAQRFARPSGE